MNNKNNIPKHWKLVEVGEYVISIKGKKPKRISPVKTKECNVPYVNIKAFEKNIIDEYTDGVGCALCEEDDFLMVWDGSRSGYVGKAIKGALGSTLVKLNFPNINKNYAYYFLQSKFVEINTRAKGVGIPHVDPSLLWNYEFPIPPLPEQQQIVSKIEELLSDLDNGKQQLHIAQRQLKVYRQSLLKWAFEGKLTSVRTGRDLSQKVGELLKGWKFVSLKEVCEIKRGKSKHRPRNEPSLFGGKYPFIQTGDIRNTNGGYITKYSQTYSEKGLQQSKLWPKETLCITIAANIGETAILGIDACFPDSVVGLVCNENFLLNKYANYFFISHKSKLEELAPATAQKNINVDILEKVKIPLPPIIEQQIIVEDLESKLTNCDKIEETISQSLQQAETLRQSILKRAFEGKLINQII
jgi:type I restriction enzyme S subunit